MFIKVSGCGSMGAPRGKETAEEALRGWCACGHDVNRWFGNTDTYADVPCPIFHRRRKAMVVHDESAHADTCCDPAQTHDCDDEDFCALVHLQIPHHDGGNGYNDQIHEDAEGATRQDERPGIDTLPTGHNSAIRSNSVHARFGPDVADGFALNYVDERCCDSV